jgi:hypothetical protein
MGELKVLELREGNLRLGPVKNREAAAKAVPESPVKRLHCDL